MDIFTGSTQQQSVLIVDDTPSSLELIGNILKQHYQVKVAKNGETALRIAHSTVKPDIILLDIMMPEMDGYDICRLLKQDAYTAAIPVMFLTARIDLESETYGLSLGAVDYIYKPINPPILLARVKTQLQVKAAANFLVDNSRYLEQEVVRRTHETQAIQKLLILTLSTLVGCRNRETSRHLLRTQHYVKALAECLRFKTRFVGFLSDYNINMLFWAAPLHDIGMVVIPDRIIAKPYQSRLSPKELEIMRSHTTLGWNAIHKSEQTLGVDTEFFSIAKDIILSHHEKMDGSGYPLGLVGDEIPIPARLMAIADVYDAIINKISDRGSIAHQRAVGIMCEGNGSHFDPDMLEAFVEIQDEFHMIACRYAES